MMFLIFFFFAVGAAAIIYEVVRGRKPSKRQRPNLRLIRGGKRKPLALSEIATYQPKQFRRPRPGKD